ncbi:UDP-N-acetylmuramate dehydrogenase [Robiginitalea sp. M366]|uniref:UDP-N-acetylmuramate dehydrogenase n=1 Tax=Robiginitalea aestuariiviva TaxID=3036903 RepID=UPI00240D354F|nr:UDP-N-acetylmuramate dehydrogenase [Robiginitalea aestuariiviva]MDG1570759.1 UDP-N-acetylmuramate dehydrogenase [Robiginitalea aestuariiviva]
MRLERNVSLKPYNTFGMHEEASHFVRVTSLDTLREALRTPGVPPPFLLSGGSNLLLTGPLEALVLYMDTRGREIVYEDGDTVRLRVLGGEIWHDLVMWTLEQGYGGLENLALIPGKTGTAPVQNIGAYGVELKDVMHSCQAVELATGKLREFSREACRFGYRDSIFKNEARGQYAIWSVTLELTCRNHRIRDQYGAIRQQLEQEGISSPTPADVARAVIAIRSSKLPDPARLGNSGSFFKNPVVQGPVYERLKEQYTDLPGYPQADGSVKVPAGWLIEHLGFKGIRRGDAGVHAQQALVLVNYGQARGSEILALAREIQEKVQQAFGIVLEPEVNVL